MQVLSKSLGGGGHEFLHFFVTHDGVLGWHPAHLARVSAILWYRILFIKSRGAYSFQTLLRGGLLERGAYLVMHKNLDNFLQKVRQNQCLRAIYCYVHSSIRSRIMVFFI